MFIQKKTNNFEPNKVGIAFGSLGRPLCLFNLPMLLPNTTFRSKRMRKSTKTTFRSQQAPTYHYNDLIPDDFSVPASAQVTKDDFLVPASAQASSQQLNYRHLSSPSECPSRQTRLSGPSERPSEIFLAAEKLQRAYLFLYKN